MPEEFNQAILNVDYDEPCIVMMVPWVAAEGAGTVAQATVCALGMKNDNEVQD